MSALVGERWARILTTTHRASLTGLLEACNMGGLTTPDGDFDVTELHHAGIFSENSRGDEFVISTCCVLV